MERQGRKIGIVGLVNEETPSLASPCKEAVFGPAETACCEAVASLRAQGVNIVIALTHLGLNVDCELAGRVDGVDVFVGGHTHSLLSNTNPKAVGPYPIVKHSPSGEPVLGRDGGVLLQAAWAYCDRLQRRGHRAALERRTHCSGWPERHRSA